ncbi:helix-turn-helix domain-containing protein [Nocardia terpenica]|uniref:helix-turn-helix domain-containing protein n=1 Tax=Nocardia terpenica TaxID=455432 RepID=UPI0035A1BCFC
MTLRLVPGLLDLLKEARGFTEEELAAALDVHKETLRRVRNGHPPSPRLIAHVASLSGRSIEKVVEVVVIKQAAASIPAADRRTRPLTRCVRASCTCRANGATATAPCRRTTAPSPVTGTTARR